MTDGRLHLSTWIWIAAGVVSYLLGALPNGLLIARARGVDIRKVGSGNIGATNVFRSVGKGSGLLTFLLDALKGFVPAFGFALLIDALWKYESGVGFRLLCGMMAVAGHNWPVYLKFKGGKGVATSAGALLAVAPLAVGVGFAAWILCFLTTRYVSLASILAAACLPVTAWCRRDADEFLMPSVLTLLALVVIWRHRANIQRLLNGNENRFQFRKKG